MIDAAYAQRMARYNRWQNQNLYGVADALSDEERRRDRGAFFNSIHDTLGHLLWGDFRWMSRFSDWPAPASHPSGRSLIYPDRDWAELKSERAAADDRLIAWADGIDPTWLAGDITWYSGAAKADVTRPVWSTLIHFFNHQTHHRGQVHAMLTAAGGTPHATDLFLLPEQNS